MGKVHKGQSDYSVPTISLGKLLLDKLRKNGDNLFLVDGYTGKKVTYKEVHEQSVKLAQFFHHYGIKVGDRISIVAENRLEWLIPLCAILYIGAIIVPYNPAYTEYELQYALNIAKPRIIFVTRRTEPILVKIQPNLSWRTELIQLDDQSFGNIRTMTGILTDEKPIDILTYETTDIGDNAKQPACILSSSGTTGLPKGVTLSHRNLLSFIVKLFRPDNLNLKPRERFILLLPFYHGYAFGTLLMAIYGNIMIVLSTFEPELFLRLIQEYKINFLPIVPPILTFLAKHPMVEQYDFRSVKQILCGAAPFAKETAAQVKARTGIKYIRNGYGLTEVSIISNLSSLEDDVGSGKIFPGFFAKVIDLETRRTLDVGQVGEICFMGDQVMMYYWNNPESTRETIDQDGWLHTGDVGYFDEKGRVHVVDRLKELIKYKGYQVSPSEIEGLLLSHPAVKDAAVASKADERSGEVPIAFIVKKPNANITVRDIQQFIEQKLSPQKWLRGGVQFVDAIPKNTTGKILRRELRAMVAKL